MISTEVAHNPKLGGRTNQGQFRLENYLGPLFFFHVYCFRLDFSLKPQYAVLQEYSNILIKFLSRAWVKPWPNRKHLFLKILLKNRTELHFFILRISKRTTSFYFLFLQISPNSRDCRFPCTLTHAIILFAYIGYNKRAPLTISSSQCHIPHIEIILVIMKFESGKTSS